MFLNVIMLAGLGGAAVPLVIHLLSRARYRTVEWGAMMFLDPAPRAHPHVGRLREAALLTVRMGAVALLAIALARPVTGSFSTASPAPDRARVAAAIVVDCSASMSHADLGGSRMDQAKAMVLRILSTLRRGDRVCLIAASAAESNTAPAFTGDLQALAARAGELRATAGGAELDTALTDAADALQHQDGVRRLYVVTDQQAQTWRTVGDDAFAAAFRRRLAQIGATCAVLPVGDSDVEDVATTAAEVVNAPAVAGVPTMVDVTIRNFGHEPRLGLPLFIRSSGRPIGSATVNLEPMRSLTVTCPVTFPLSGPTVMTAECRGDASDIDDRRDVVVDVSPPIQVLVVRGSPPGGVDHLMAALAPFRASGREGTDLCVPTLVSGDKWDESALDRYQVLILEDLASLNSSQARAVERFVYAGGGLLLAPGPGARVGDYNRLLYDEESGLLPALLLPFARFERPVAADPASLDLGHPLLRFLADRKDFAGVFDGCLPISNRMASARVLANLTSGDPLLLETPFGRGRVLLMTATLGAEGSTLPQTASYLPLVQSIVRNLAAAALPRRNVEPGQELVATFDAELNATRATVERPDGRRDTIDLLSMEGWTEARYTETRLPGVYIIRPQRRAARGEENNPAILFAVAPSSAESDLTPLSPQRWSELSASLGITRLESPTALVAQRAAEESAGTRYWLAALAAVLGLFVVELALTRAWAGGEE